ncbi:MAG: 2Fe-2S iron-sulfur cluster binding domain-containing protein [Flavobacteriales bacterium]|nr:2Fe-2S iron-sulfur cluster binding domain-containing protein [Flavobacteriales bacterium]
MDFYSLRIKEINKETSDSVSLTFDIPEDIKDKFSFEAGHYLTLEALINHQPVRRAYSIWKAPFENEVSVLVKEISDGLFSSYANNELKVGDSIKVSSPAGNFQISSAKESKTTFFAAGSGITPIVSMIKQQLFNNSESSIVLFYVNKDHSSTIFKTELEKLQTNFPNQLTVHHLFTREDNSSNQFSGRINEAKCEELFSKNALSLQSEGYYMCGPEEMILSTKDYLISKSVDSGKIHFELFTSKDSDKSDFESHIDEATVHITIDDDEFEFEYTLSQADSLLDAGNDSGLDMPFSCKGGVCCTCKAKVMEGTAMMIKNFALTDEEVEEGYILTCQSHPTSEKLVLSFDE